MSLDTNMIRTKTKGFYDTLLGAAGPDDDGDEEGDIDNPQSETSSDSPMKVRGFLTTKTWFEKFQKRFGLRSVPMYGEAASADTAPAQRYFEEEFLQIIEERVIFPNKLLI